MLNILIVVLCLLIRVLAGREIMTVISSRTYVYSFLYEKTMLLPNDGQMDYFSNFILQQSKEMNYLSKDAIDILYITPEVDYSNLVTNLDFLQKIYVYNNTHFAVNFLLPINSSGAIPVKQNSIRRVMENNHTGLYNIIFSMEDGTSIVTDRVVCVNIIYNEWCRVFNTTPFFFNITENPNIYHDEVNKQMYTMWVIMEIIKLLIPLMYIIIIFIKKKYIVVV